MKSPVPHTEGVFPLRQSKGRRKMEEEEEQQNSQPNRRRKSSIVIKIPSYQEVIESSQSKSTPPFLFNPSQSFSQAFSFIKSSEFYTPPPPLSNTSSSSSQPVQASDGTISRYRICFSSIQRVYLLFDLLFFFLALIVFWLFCCLVNILGLH